MHMHAEFRERGSFHFPAASAGIRLQTDADADSGVNTQIIASDQCATLEKHKGGHASGSYGLGEMVADKCVVFGGAGTGGSPLCAVNMEQRIESNRSIVMEELKLTTETTVLYCSAAYVVVL